MCVTGGDGAHHPVGPMVSALTRALSVSLRSSSIARLDGYININHVSGGETGQEVGTETAQGEARRRLT